MPTRFSCAALLALTVTPCFTLCLGFATPSLARDSARLVDALCQITLRLQPGTAQFGACTDSLGDTAQGLRAADAVEVARQSCQASGLTDGASGMAMCILDRRKAAAHSSAPAIGPAPRDNGPSYWRASFDQQRSREEHACAALALEPGGMMFARCVASLDSALFTADNPLR
jgi:hypothetical protein